ncbi:hypothetical protein [Chryseobacterium foetidum]|uniref:hypothetical protein n=1 Tax=Chryseobacterium foetidum TaxID=2951057 RepID=UPI0021C7D901|nr:hypothetical protein [Chryseobacterium foetidum]
MGLFNFFKKEPEKTFQSNIGIFKLVKGKSSKRIWLNNQNLILFSVNGNENNPDLNHINFLDSYSTELDKIDDKITTKFINLLKEAELESDFNHWKERFKINAITTFIIERENKFLEISFQDLKSPFYHFNLTVENENLTDFSIDS